MKIDVYVKAHPYDNNGVLITFIDPYHDDFAPLNNIVDLEFSILKELSKLPIHINDEQGRAFVRNSIISHITNVSQDSDYKKAIKEVLLKELRPAQIPNHVHTISDTVYIGSIGNDDFYTRESITGKVLDIRHSNNPEDYTTWSLFSLNNLLERDFESILSIIPLRIMIRIIDL